LSNIMFRIYCIDRLHNIIFSIYSLHPHTFIILRLVNKNKDSVSLPFYPTTQSCHHPCSSSSLVHLPISRLLPPPDKTGRLSRMPLAPSHHHQHRPSSPTMCTLRAHTHGWRSSKQPYYLHPVSACRRLSTLCTPAPVHLPLIFSCLNNFS
jgi:hypothetical protein